MGQPLVVVDTSAMVAVLLREPGFEVYETVLARSRPVVPSICLLEGTITLTRRSGRDERPAVDRFVATTSAFVMPIGRDVAALASEAFVRFGKGRHPAALNFGDCIPYAAARALGLPLLFKGDDFARTDIVSATSRSGPEPRP